MTLRISISGIRGIIGDGLDGVVAARWAAAMGAWLPPGPVVIGRDPRPSGPMIRDAVVAALCSTGHDVWDIGIATTPTTELAVAQSEAVGGIIITASHNPQAWNALKFLAGSGLFLTANENRELREHHEAQDGQEAQDASVGHVAWDQLGVACERGQAEERHIAAVLALPWLDPDQIRARGLRVVVDAVEGAGGRIMPRLLEELGVACIPLHCGLSGHFPHDPEPTPAHLAELGERVQQEGADLGLALDPDGDRLALVDETGRPLSEELTLVLAMDFLLARQKGPVAVNLSTTGLIEEVAARHDVEVFRTPVGEANVVETLLGKDCVVGGEGNGGVIYPTLHAGRDAMVGSAMILQSLVASGRSLSELVAAFPPLVMVKTKVASEQPPDPEDLARILGALGPGEIDDRDGLKWIGAGEWLHARASNTEPVLRIIAEASSEARARDLIERIRTAI